MDDDELIAAVLAEEAKREYEFEKALRNAHSQEMRMLVAAANTHGGWDATETGDGFDPISYGIGSKRIREYVSTEELPRDAFKRPFLARYARARNSQIMGEGTLQQNLVDEYDRVKLRLEDYKNMSELVAEFRPKPRALFSSAPEPTERTRRIRKVFYNSVLRNNIASYLLYPDWKPL